MIDSASMRSLERFLDFASQRHKVLASNVANIDTPGYRTRDVDFRAAVQSLAVGGPGANRAHEVVGLMERPDGNNVSLDRESMALAENQLKFRLGVQLLRSEFHKLTTAINEGKQQ